MQVNQPQVYVAIDGLPVPGPLSLEVESVAYFSADRFRAVFAVGATDATSIGFFAGLTAQSITIDLALGGAGFVNLMTGQIDNVLVNLLENTASICGRDLSAQLIDAEITESFANQTASQIALTIAARFGLTANVTPTGTAVGQYYDLDHARHALGVNARATTAWSLLTWLAHIEGFAVSVTGSTLNFGPLAVSAPVFLTPQNFISLTLDTATAIPAAVTVKSWNTRNKVVNTQMAGDGSPATTLIKPSLTAAQASALASDHLALLARQTTILSATLPGEIILSPGAQIILAGTGSAYDQTYAIEAMTRSLDARHGFVESIRAYAVI